MKKMQKKFSAPTAIFMLLAVLALTIMGMTAGKAEYSDLHSAALRLADESTREIRQDARKEIFKHPGAIVRGGFAGTGLCLGDQVAAVCKQAGNHQCLDRSRHGVVAVIEYIQSALRKSKLRKGGSKFSHQKIQSVIC